MPPITPKTSSEGFPVTIVYIPIPYPGKESIGWTISWKVHCFRAVLNWALKVISRLLWFCFTTLCDWLPKFTPLPQPMRSKTKTNRAWLARVFPRLALVTCISFEFCLVHCVVYVFLWYWIENRSISFICNSYCIYVKRQIWHVFINIFITSFLP